MKFPSGKHASTAKLTFSKVPGKDRFAYEIKSTTLVGVNSASNGELIPNLKSLSAKGKVTLPAHASLVLRSRKKHGDAWDYFIIQQYPSK